MDGGLDCRGSHVGSPFKMAQSSDVAPLSPTMPGCKMMHRCDSQIDRGMIRVSIGERIKSGWKVSTACVIASDARDDGDADPVLKRPERHVRMLRETVRTRWKGAGYSSPASALNGWILLASAGRANRVDRCCKRFRRTVALQ